MSAADNRLLKGVLFDFDGTIFHLESVHQRVISDAFKAHTGREVHEDENRSLIGIPYVDRFSQLLAMHQVEEDPDELLEKLCETAYASIVERSKDVRELLVPGVDVLIRSLYDAGIPIAVVSSSLTEHIKDKLTQVDLLKYFDHITGRDSVAMIKPHPEPYERSMGLLDIPAEGTVAIEDSPAGIESAWLAGCSVIGIATTYEEHEIDKAHHVIRDYTAVTIETFESILQENTQ